MWRAFVTSNDMRVLRPLAALFFGGILLAHPMGNLSVNHYARLEPGAKGVDVTYVLDLAEIPTFELTQSWNVPRDSAKAILDARAVERAREWVANLTFTEGGRALTPKIEGTELAIVDGAGNLPVFRITTKLHVPGSGGRFEYEDRNYPTRAGWREIVIQPGAGAAVSRASNGDTDVSRGLTSYPQDPTKAPPQDTHAWFEWTRAPGVMSQVQKPVVEAKAAPAPVDAPALMESPRDVRPPEVQSMGVVKRNDAISTILRMKTISWPLLATLIGLAFWFGALHALEPGHGKTMVAAYLVGERGTAKHAMLLGGMVTFTHTISVFILGLATMFLSRYIMPDKISKVLGIVSGFTIIWIGAMLLWRRARSLRKARAHVHHRHDHGHGHPHYHAHPHAHDHAHMAHDHSHDDGHSHDHGHEHVHAHGDRHPHPHDHEHSHDRQSGHDHGHAHDHGHSHDHEHHHPHSHAHEHPHAHDHGHGHDHGHEHVRVAAGHNHDHDHAHGHGHEHDHTLAHGGLTHTHDGHTHSHVPEGEISLGSLMALGASGGLVPCPSALILLLSAISIGRVGLGMVLLLAFSLGLALVLMATGMAVLYAKNLFPERKGAGGAFFRYMPVISAAAIVVIGVVMTTVSLGWFQAGRFIG